MSLRWPPIENNPDVLTQLAHSLGLSPSLQFHDIYSFDPDVLAFTPRPVKALIMVFPTDESLHHPASITSENEVVWIKQTIGNACGTMAMLHVLTNTPDLIDSSAAFATTLEQLRLGTPTDRVNEVETNALLREAHYDVASLGQSQFIEAEENVTLHFIAFVESGGELFQLDGSQDGPISHGPVVGEDIMDEGIKAVQSVIKQIGDDVQVSVCALA